MMKQRLIWWIMRWHCCSDIKRQEQENEVSHLEKKSATRTAAAEKWRPTYALEPRARSATQLRATTLAHILGPVLRAPNTNQYICFSFLFLFFHFYKASCTKIIKSRKCALFSFGTEGLFARHACSSLLTSDKPKRWRVKWSELKADAGRDRGRKGTLLNAPSEPKKKKRRKETSRRVRI